MSTHTRIDHTLLYHTIISKNYDSIKDIFRILKSFRKKEEFWADKLKIVFSKDNYREKNRLMPSKKQIQILEDSSRNLKSCSSQELWYHFMKPHYELMFDAFDKKQRKKAMKDQDVRANDIYIKMKQKNQKHLITMDGHGRFIMTFMKCLSEKKENLNEWKFTVIDIDEDVDKWHKLFFPKSFICKKCDIFTYLQEFKKKNIYFIYMNFCSILSGLKEKCYQVLTAQNFKDSVIVSFSTRNRCKEDYTKQNKLTGNGLLNKLLHYGASIICKRSFFVTLFI